MISGKRILITGGAGFIGSHLVDRLRADNHLTLFDTLDRNALADRSVDTTGLSVVVGDVRDAAAVTEVMAGQQVVIHCAAVAGIDTVVRSPVRTLGVNILGSWNVLEAAAHAGEAERVVCFSTSEVYGRHADRVSEDDDAKVGPVGHARYTYAAGKLAEEHLALAYNAEFGLPTVVLRPFNVYGPGQVGEGAIRTFIRSALAGETIVIHGSGLQVRSWTFVSDMVDSVVAAAERSEAVGQHFNIGNPDAAVTISELARLVIETAGSSSEIRHEAGDVADVAIRIPVIDRARALLGFEPVVGLEDGLKQTIAYFGSHFA